MFPPGTDRTLIKSDFLKRPDEDNEAITYFVKILPRILQTEADHFARTGRRRLHVLECVQYPGETIYVPSGWHHAVLNLEDSIAITQNYCSSANFPRVWRSTRRNRKKMALKWKQMLRQSKWRELAEIADAIDLRDGWDGHGAGTSTSSSSSSSSSSSDSD